MEYLTARVADLNRDFARCPACSRPSGVPGFQGHPSGLVKPADASVDRHSLATGGERGQPAPGTAGRERDRDGRGTPRRVVLLFRPPCAKPPVGFGSLAALRLPTHASVVQPAAPGRQELRGKNIRRRNQLTDQPTRVNILVELPRLVKTDDTFVAADSTLTRPAAIPRGARVAEADPSANLMQVSVRWTLTAGYRHCIRILLLSFLV